MRLRTRTKQADPLSRRHFLATSATACAASAAMGSAATARTAARAAAQAAAQGLRVNGGRVNGMLADLRRFGGTPDGGTTRLAYSDEDLAGRDYATGVMDRAGLRVSTDLAGNLIGLSEGTDPGLRARPIVVGSHIDTVPGGGSYDGQVGAAGALEVALTLDEHGVRTRHPLEIAIFQNEEGGKTGSRALVGRVEPFELEIETASGFAIRDGIARLGGDPDRLDQARRTPGDMAGFFELHVEQGGHLEATGVQIGVVEGIVGIRRWNVEVRGMANHAGTTPMNQRRDALVAAADFVRAVHEVASGMPGRQVATVGRIEATPGAPNVVPGTVRASLEIRDLSMAKIDRVFAEVDRRAAAIAQARDVSIGFVRFYESLAAPTDPGLRDIVEGSAAALGFSSTRMPSGAGHDAQSMAELGPVGMIFVPSRDGISHSPLEHTPAADVTRGADVLLRSVLALDEAD